MSSLTPAPYNFQQRIRSELAEVLQLGYGDIIPSILHLRQTMEADPADTVAPAAKTDLYRINGSYNFVAIEIRGHLALNEVATEDTVGMTGMMAIGSAEDRIIAKALNAKIALVNPDRGDMRFVESQIQNSSASGVIKSELSLASLLPMCGGRPIKLVRKNYVMPLIVPAGERLQMTVTLAKPMPAIGQTEYGLTLIGALVRTRA